MVVWTSPDTNHVKTHKQLTGIPLIQLAFFKLCPHVHFLPPSFVIVALQLLKGPWLMLLYIAFTYIFIKMCKRNVTANNS